jgi:hypothetical protein
MLLLRGYDYLNYFQERIYQRNGQPVRKNELKLLLASYLGIINDGVMVLDIIGVDLDTNGDMNEDEPYVDICYISDMLVNMIASDCQQFGITLIFELR